MPGDQTAALIRDARYYRARVRELDDRLVRGRYRGRIKDVRERELWLSLAEEVERYLARNDPNDASRAPGPDDVALF